MLDVASLRVEAALALARLVPGLDPAPLLPVLVAALESPRDVDQLTACEAIVVLTAPTVPAAPTAPAAPAAPAAPTAEVP